MNEKKMSMKVVTLVLAAVLVFGCAVGGTLAWLQDTTDPVVNTFTEGKVDIDLYETPVNGGTNKANTYKMVPGDVLDKDPTVVVKKGSEACWLFVKVEEINDVDTFLTYSVDTTVWTPLVDTNGDGVADNGVYYKEITAYTAADTEYNVLTGKQVTVKTGVVMADMEKIDASNYPQLKFTAFAIQSANIADANNNGTAADEAWTAMGNT